MEKRNIPLLDLKKQYAYLKEEVENKVIEVMEKAQYVMGPDVKKFEEEIAEYTGAKYAISCANGTDALVLALRALGIAAGDEVITTPFTFFATAEAISAVGAIPVFVDVEKDTFNLDPSKIEAKINNKTKAIIPVHIFGQPCKMDEISEIAKKYNLFIIEDACQAIGAEYKNKKVGSIGDIGCFSFFPTKNLGAFGDGGMLTTNDEKIYKILKALRVHGSGEAGEEAYAIINDLENNVKSVDLKEDMVYNPSKYYNYLIGYNSRLDEIQAAILRIKLKRLDEWNEKRSEAAVYYNEKLKNSELVLPYVDADVKTVYHLYIVQSEKRDLLAKYLKEKGIATGIYYPIPLHLQKVYTDLKYSVGELPVAEYLSSRTIAIPIYPELEKEDMDYIIKAIFEFEGSR